MANLVLLPAYGRSYNTRDSALADWKGGKDFKIANGPYCSIRDTKPLIEGGYENVIFTATTRGGYFLPVPL